MNKEQFQAIAIDSLLPIKEKVGCKRIAADLYTLYEMKGNFETYSRHISACFDKGKPEFFHFCDVVNMCRMYGVHEPLFFFCAALGFDEPKPLIEVAHEELAIINAAIPEIRRRLEAHQNRRNLLLCADPQSTAAIKGARFSI